MWNAKDKAKARPLLVTDGNKIVRRGAGISPLPLPIPSTDCEVHCHDDVNGDESGPFPNTALTSLRTEI